MKVYMEVYMEGLFRVYIEVSLVMGVPQARWMVDKLARWLIFSGKSGRQKKKAADDLEVALF